MLDKIRGWLAKIVEFWNRFTSKQKTLIIIIAAAVIFTLVALVVVLNRSHYVPLTTFDNTKDAATAKELLDGDPTIDYKVSNDGLVFTVNEKNESAARLLLGQNNIATESNQDQIDFLFGGSSMSTTDRERKLREKIYTQNDLEGLIEQIDGIKTANVQINIPDTTTSLLSEVKPSSASVLIVTTEDFDVENVEGIANLVSKALGNDNNDDIRIVDQSGTLLFGGDSTSSAASAGSAAQSIKIKNEVTANLEDRVRNLFVNSGTYNDAEVKANLDINLDLEKVNDELHYTLDDEEDTGPLVETYTYNAENVDGVGGIPGTDSNDEDANDYDIYDGSTGNSSANVVKQVFHDSVKTTVTERAVGKVNTDSSSIAVILSRYAIYDEAQLKKTGELKGTNFESFMAENSERKALEVDEDTINVVAKATGIPADSISIQAWEVPIFYPQERSALDVAANYLQFLLAILIVALLAFVVFKGMKPVEVTEMEPELSVEALLATTKENQSLEDIEFSDKSATRQQIERFVDENPEEVALLLRNWLNEEWD